MHPSPTPAKSPPMPARPTPKSPPAPAEPNRTEVGPETQPDRSAPSSAPHADPAPDRRCIQTRSPNPTQRPSCERRRQPLHGPRSTEGHKAPFVSNMTVPDVTAWQHALSSASPVSGPLSGVTSGNLHSRR